MTYAHSAHTMLHPSLGFFTYFVLQGDAVSLTSNLEPFGPGATCRLSPTLWPGNMVHLLEAVVSASVVEPKGMEK